MAKLGQIEAVAKDLNREADTFDMLGETFEVRRRPDAMDSIRAAAITSNDEWSEGEKLSRLTTFAEKLLRKCLDEPTFQRYSQLCEDNELGIDVVWSTVQLLLGAAAGRPTGKSSDSSDGSSTTSTSSSSEPVGLMDYAKKGLHLVPVEEWAKEYMPEAV